MFIGVLLTVADTYIKPTYSSTDEWIKKTWYIHTMKYYSAVKKKNKKRNNAICNNKDGPRYCHPKHSKSNTEK